MEQLRFANCDKLIIVLEKLNISQTDEDRSDIIDKTHAKYKGRYLKILNIFDPKTCCSFETYDIYSKYDIIEDEMIYFLDRNTAIYYNIYKNYTGTINLYYDNGLKFIEYNYMNGKIHGQYTCWYLTDNNQIMETGNYVNGKREGKFISWFANGNILRQCEYKNGELNGKFISWDQNGNINRQCII